MFSVVSVKYEFCFVTSYDRKLNYRIHMNKCEDDFVISFC